jgi:hypothetical protein
LGIVAQDNNTKERRTGYGRPQEQEASARR